ncbi:MAG: AAA family ATPase [Nannocystaceae bacterium]
MELLHVSTLWRLERGVVGDSSETVLLRRPRSDSAARRAELRHELALRDRLPPTIALRPRSLERLSAGVALVYDDCDGRPLAARASLRWRPAEVAAFARRAAEALAILHAAGIIHGGLHPGAILVADDGALRLTEFTAAGIASKATVIDESSRIGAELAYIAPEQTGRMNRPIDRRCDLYSLGVVLYELLTGSPPFVSDDPLELIHSHMTAEPPPLHAADDRGRALTAAIRRLLAKEPEDRLADAGELLDALRDGRPSAAAEPTLRLPETLYARDRERAALRAAFTRVRDGRCGLVLVSGSAGAGKSSLVLDVFRPIGAREGLFVAGTCDPLRRGVPFAAIVDVARGLLQYVLTLDNAAVAQWRARIVEATGATLPVLAAALPDALPLVGEHEAPTTLPAADAQRRLELALQRFIAAFAREVRPLIVLLDDLQWIDEASLRLLKALLYDAADLHLLLVGALRDDAAPPEHRLRRFVDEARALPSPPVELRLEPLDEPAVRALLHDALGYGDVSELVDELLLRTGGNPLFVREFLRFLDRQRLLRYDAREGSWTWEPRRLDATVLPDSVAELLGAELGQLPAQTRRALQYAACVGMRFDAATLADLTGSARAELDAALAPAIELDLLVDESTAPADGPRTLRFLHDRIRLEAAGPLRDDERQRVHADIGRRLLARADDPAALSDEALFDLVDHLNSGAAHLQADERARLIRLDLAAAQRAKASAAYQVARVLLRTASELVDACDVAPALAFAVRAERVECEHLAGDNRGAMALLDALEPTVDDLVMRLRLADLRVILEVSAGATETALAAGRAALAAAGLNLPTDAEACRAAVDAEFASIEAQLAATPLRERIASAAIANPVIRAILTLLADMLAPANMLHPDLYALINTTQIRLSIEHGHTDVSAYTYVVFGYFVATARGQYAQAEGFGRFALELNEALGNTAARCRIRFVFATYAHFFRPLRAVLGDLSAALDDGLESGDYIYLSMACSHVLIVRLSLGEPLDEVAEQADQFLELMERTRVASSIASQRVARQLVAALRGETFAPARLADESFDEEAFVDACRRSGRTFALHWYATASLQLAVLCGDEPRARELLREYGAAIRSNYAFYFATEFAAYACLALLDRAAAAADAATRAAALAELGDYEPQLLAWDAACPANYRALAQLVAADKASLRGDEAAALAAYDRALACARAEGQASREALICERAAAHHRRRGREQLAKGLLREAAAAYQRWGAARRVAELSASASERATPQEARDVTAADLDLRGVLQASQALSSALRFDELIRSVMRIVALTASATRALLLLDDETAGLQLTATSGAHGRLDRPRSLDADADAPVAAVRLSFRTLRPIALDDRAHAGLRASDPYLARAQPRSALCVPLVFQGRGLGVLYVEHATASGVFTPARREALGLLSSQIAISLEHARLYANVDRAREAAEAANRAKSTFLATMSHELRTPLNSILGYTELIIDESTERGETASLGDLDRVLRSGRHLLEVISDILDLSKIEADKVELERTELEVLPLLERVVEATAPTIAANGNQLLFAPTGELGRIRGDPLRLRQILLNLLGNAAKFTRDGQVTLSAARSGARIRFVVRDTGIGMTRDDLGRIFEAFQQVDDSTTRRFGGTGLGLTISQRLARLMGGEITVDSALGEGSRFTLDLPTDLPQDRSQAPDKEP